MIETMARGCFILGWDYGDVHQHVGRFGDIGQYIDQSLVRVDLCFRSLDWLLVKFNAFKGPVRLVQLLSRCHDKAF